MWFLIAAFAGLVLSYVFDAITSTEVLAGAVGVAGIRAIVASISAFRSGERDRWVIVQLFVFPALMVMVVLHKPVYALIAAAVVFALDYRRWSPWLKRPRRGASAP